jgi:signal transduction histidine kinase
MSLAAAQSMAEVRLRESIDVAERERARWARELHDETLQGLGALRVRLSASLRLDRAEMAEAVEQAIAQIEDEIANLRSLITELRPAVLDELGLGAAIEGLAENHAASTGTEIHVDLELQTRTGSVRLDREVESAVFRLVQEALSNVAKHANAESVWLNVTRDSDAISIGIRDDGAGFDMDSRSNGFGLVGMRERVALAGGSLTIVSTPGVGTELRGRVPLERPSRGQRSEDRL